MSQKASFARVSFLAMLAAFVTANFRGLTTPKLKLFKGNPSLTQFTVFADLDFATGSWAIVKAAVVSDAVENTNDGSLNLVIESASWQYSGSDPTETITGVALTDGSTNLIAAWKFASPFIMQNSLDWVFSDLGYINFPPSQP